MNRRCKDIKQNCSKYISIIPINIHAMTVFDSFTCTHSNTNNKTTNEIYMFRNEKINKTIDLQET